ncbi:MAG: HNH endonuclease, partial [Planctomycetota bacterium]
MKETISRAVLEPLVAAGQSTHQIAKVLGCSQNKVWRNCRVHGLERLRLHAGSCLVCGATKSRRSLRFCSNKCQRSAASGTRMELLSASGDTTGFGVRLVKRFVVRRDGHRCAICLLETWQGQAIPLVLDHIDGDSTNRSTANLRLVCGNCDMQLPTYKSKNRGRGRAWRRLRYAEGK